MRTIAIILSGLLAVSPLFAENGDTGIMEDPFQWDSLGVFSDGASLNGRFTGVVDGYIIHAGGHDTSHAEWAGSIDILNIDYKQWLDKPLIQLPEPLSSGASISAGNAFYLLGGKNDSGVSSSAFRIRFNEQEQDWTLDRLPSLPVGLSTAAACVYNENIYLFGGKKGDDESNHDVFSLSLKSPDQWQKVSTLEVDLLDPSIVIQNEGDQDAIYILPKNCPDLFCYRPYNNSWIHRTEIPDALINPLGFQVGSAHILYLEGEKQADPAVHKAWFYHTITDTWTKANILVNDAVRHYEAGTFYYVERLHDPGHTLLYKAETRKSTVRIRFFDALTFIVYFVVLLYMGYWFSRKMKSTDDYFRGGKSVPAWAAGISIVATKLSAVTFMSIPAKVYATDWFYILIPFNALVLLYFVNRVILPFYQRMDLTSAYEYLEKRYSTATRKIGSIVYLFWEAGRVGVLLLLPAIVISVVTGFNIFLCIILIGVVATIYTYMGGIEAVIWTDVIQVFIMLGGIIIAIIVIVFNTSGTFGELVELAREQGKLRAFNFDFNLTTATVWVIVIGWIGRIQEYVSVQSIVQRFVTTKDEKAARKSMWISAIIGIPVVLIFFVAGTALYLYYREFPSELNPVMDQADAILPTFFVLNLPVGLTGLVIAAIFAAAMSSLDSAINSMSTVIITDFYLANNPTEHRKQNALKLARYLVGILGVVGTVSALVMALFPVKSLFDQVMLIMGLTGGGLAGMFLLGMLTKRANSMGVLTGFTLSCFIQYLVSFHTDLHFLLYAVTGLLSCFILGYIASFFYSANSGDSKNYTVYALKNR